MRVQATPDRPDDGARLADEIIDALASVTGEHAVIADDDGKHPAAANDGDEPTKEDSRSRAATPVGRQLT